MGESDDGMAPEGTAGDGPLGDGAFRESTFEDGSRAGRRRPGHVDRAGRPRMTDVTDRPVAARRAVAEAEVTVSHETLSAIIDGTNPKGDVLSVAELAGVMAGKKASELIPLCHPVALTDLLVRAVPERAGGLVRIRVETATIGPSGVEMEALTAASVAALTVYDMVRDIDPSAAIRGIKLISHSSGEGSGWQRTEQPGFAPRPPRGARVAGRIVGSPPRGAPGGRPVPRRHGT